MSYRNLLLIAICFAIGLVSCKKGSNENSGPIAGKWQETKLSLYTDSTGKLLYDTTYTKPFTNSDYVQFNNNSTCAIAQDHYYYLNSPSEPKTPQKIPASIGAYNYKTVGAKYVLTYQTQFINPGGFSQTDTITMLSTTSLVLHTTYYGPVPTVYNSTSDAYFQR